MDTIKIKVLYCIGILGSLVLVNGVLLPEVLQQVHRGELKGFVITLLVNTMAFLIGVPYIEKKEQWANFPKVIIGIFFTYTIGNIIYMLMDAHYSFNLWFLIHHLIDTPLLLTGVYLCVIALLYYVFRNSERRYFILVATLCVIVFGFVFNTIRTEIEQSRLRIIIAMEFMDVIDENYEGLESGDKDIEDVIDNINDTYLMRQYGLHDGLEAYDSVKDRDENGVLKRLEIISNRMENIIRNQSFVNEDTFKDVFVE